MGNLIPAITPKAQAFFTDTGGSHDWSHTQRVAALCEHIGKVEGGDPDILKLAAVLHDIGRPEEDAGGGAICHARRGAELARDLLAEHGAGEDIINAVAACIRTHRFRDDAQPETLEARILFDADKLDSIGAVGVGRAFLFAGEFGAKLHNSHIDIEKTRAYSEEDTAYREYMVKLRHVKDRILTDEGRRLAEERHDFMVKFFERLDQEAAGEL